MIICNTDTLKEKLVSTAQLLRLGQEAEGSKRLRECLDHLEPMLPTLTNSQAILASVPAMLSAQERQDWLGLADTLEYEITALLNQQQQIQAK
ncbi:hypothetical protein [Shewanella sp. UCD-KL12]|uniref:hypothetical protein n=1 Tax=Shewanella sp. UCD-KL12 TaxID=1917163 RepID=UPI0009712CA4|nr:hypothetical protein [Shewanella sp. UCD-KL12]